MPFQKTGHTIVELRWTPFRENGVYGRVDVFTVRGTMIPWFGAWKRSEAAQKAEKLGYQFTEGVK